MQKPRAVFIVLFLGMVSHSLKAQLGFCSGNSGVPIFTETFGTGLEDGPPLPPGTTTYQYVDGGPLQPEDGKYTISSRTNYFDWFDTLDHTPGDVNGKSFIVNASFTADEFFNRTINGLCENTSYEFSAWLLNLLPSFTVCPNGGIPINVSFEILDETGTQVLASGSTGAIGSTPTPIWRPFGLVFTTQTGQSSVILRMSNNGDGGCGNDLAIDDIVFRTCGDAIAIADSMDTPSIALCRDEVPVSPTLIAHPDFAVFQSHAYQWQQSTDNENWMDIAGENNQSYTPPPITETTFYRVLVAEDAINLTNSSCNIVSNSFAITVEDKPNAPVSLGNVTVCGDGLGAVRATVPDGVTVNWYDAPNGGNLLANNTRIYETPTSGTFYAEAVSDVAGCISDQRTPISITYFDPPLLEDGVRSLCEGTSVILSADVPNASYIWSTGETTFSISVATPGTYTVQVTDSNGCTAGKTIVVDQVDNPVLEEIRSDHRNIVIVPSGTGDFEYSLDGFFYQTSPVFEQLLGGEYQIHVRSSSRCDPVILPYIHLVIPRFFTPNGDTFNDRFMPEGAELLGGYSIFIFDRIGTLVFESSDPNRSWDGTFNGRPLPASDYWYRIQAGGNQFRGHFALKR